MNDTVTYCPEDNKIRLYVGRVPRDEYKILAAARFRSTPKQDCDFVGTWTPEREDLAITYLEEDEDIGDEDYSPQERAADRAERFEGYQEKRLGEALGHADTFDAGPSVVGMQNQAKAERAARKHDRSRTRATSQWSKAEYWQQRTAGVISSALYKSSPEVRRKRIVKLRTERRNYCTGSPRWEFHLDMRLKYEEAMLENEGGAAFNDVIEVGYVIGNEMVTKVNKSSADKRVVSVELVSMKTWEAAAKRKWCRSLAINIESLGSGHFRKPTEEELKLFKVWKAEKKAKTKAANANKPKLINPTLDEAEKLQELINKNEYHPDQWSDDKEPPTVTEITQAQYSATAKGWHKRCETKQITELFEIYAPSFYGGNNHPGRTVVFIIRMYRKSVVVLTDKKQHKLPWKKVEEITASKAQPADVLKRLHLIERKPQYVEKLTKEQNRVFQDALYLGWAFHSTVFDWGLNEEGLKQLKENGHPETKALART